MAETLPVSYSKDVQYLRLAREIAADLYEIETILKNNNINPDQWNAIKEDPRFLRLLETEVAAWNDAGNTAERTKLKSGMLIEEWLLEANQRIHDKGETLAAKTEVVKLLARIAGMGQERADPTAGLGGERFQITINLGADHKLSFQKELPAKVIDVTPEPVEES